MKPSSEPNGLKARNRSEALQEKGLCPEGMVPIARTNLFKHPEASPISTQGLNPPAHEYAIVYVENDIYYGAHAKFTLWSPEIIDDGEFSLAQLWISSGSGEDINTIEAGWQALAGDNKPRLFIYWTGDDYKSTGCYNLDCPGFVQTNKNIPLGAPISPVSSYNGIQYYIEITVHKSGNWWLHIGDQNVGYWPASIFIGLAQSAIRITWGGEILNYGLNGRHTFTQMGNGHFAGEGYGKAALLFDLKYMDDSGVLRDAENPVPYLTKASCYDLKLEEKENSLGVHFYYGGPGFSAQCP